MEQFKKHYTSSVGPFPDQLRGKDDAASKGFISHSILERLSKIVSAVPGFEQLESELKEGTFKIRHLPASDNGPSWEKYIDHELQTSSSANCMEVSWFFLENYAYRLILGEVGYFLPSSPRYLQDPWLAAKEESLRSALPSFMQVSKDVPEPRLSHLILCSLWGNRSDLSLSSGAVDSTVAEGGVAGHLLVDDAATVETILIANEKNKQPKGIIMVLDNCGAELLADLRLAAYLSRSTSVTLHVKPHPVFVSDATKTDVTRHVDRLVEAGLPLGKILRDLLAAGRIQVLDDLFYASPLEFPFAPDHLKLVYDQAALIIVKGDANYRRILCDRHFPHDFPFSQLVRATTTTPLLAVRTCKSPVILGLPKHTLDRIQALDPDWCVNGTCGVLQLSAQDE